MPGAVAQTSTLALTNATLPYVLTLARQGVISGLESNPHLLNGLNVHQGKITCAAVAAALGYAYVPPLTALGSEGSFTIPHEQAS
jgi:alanine dehydrogenase